MKRGNINAKKIFLVFVVFLIILQVYAQQTSVKISPKYPEKTAVKIFSKTGDCSAVIINKDKNNIYILTAGHCVEKDNLGDYIKVQSDSVNGDAILLGKDYVSEPFRPYKEGEAPRDKRDLALLVMNVGNQNNIINANVPREYPYKVGQKIITIDTINGKTREGTYKGTDNNDITVGFDIGINEGGSGGPCFDENGNLIGILE